MLPIIFSSILFHAVSPIYNFLERVVHMEVLLTVCLPLAKDTENKS